MVDEKNFEHLSLWSTKISADWSEIIANNTVAKSRQRLYAHPRWLGLTGLENSIAGSF